MHEWAPGATGILQSNRIILADPPTWFDWLHVRPAARMAAAIVAVSIATLLAFVLARLNSLAAVGPLIFQMALFTSIIVASVAGGFWAGVLATAASVLAGAVMPPRIVPDELAVLSVEGFLVSLVGGVLRSIRIRAGQTLAENLSLEQQILEIGDDERRRIGHDLHDGLGQHLTGISLLSETMSQHLAAGKLPAASNVETITRLVSEAVGITRDLAKSLSPVTLERDGFVAAIEELSETSSTLFGIDCHGDFVAQDLELDRTRSLHLYRIVQEAVNNSVRHGKSKHVAIRTEQRGNNLHVTVTDDGSGLSQKTMANPGLGLRIMQYRARMLSATLAVERATPSGGTVVTCICPIPPRGESA